MKASPYAPFYDLFKLIVAILLLLFFLFLTIWNPPHVHRRLKPCCLPGRRSRLIPRRQRSPLSHPPRSPQLLSRPQRHPLRKRLFLLLRQASHRPHPLLRRQKLPHLKSNTPPVAENPSTEAVCAANTRTKLQVGMKAVIQHRLNFRTTAGIHNNRLSTNPPGTQVDVIGGPQCTTYKNGSSYLWWEIKLPNGEIGWSAEASAFGGFYFMEPSQ
ncbi:MAG: SH3 domain-containing protein [Anaerolineales bacterium]